MCAQRHVYRLTLQYLMLLHVLLITLNVKICFPTNVNKIIENVIIQSAIKFFFIDCFLLVFGFIVLS